MQVDQGICHLARLPIEVRDLIAEYLVFKDRESDKEFVERAIATTKLLSPVLLSEKYSKLRVGCVEGRYVLECEPKNVASYLIDRTKILLVEKCNLVDLYGGTRRPAPKAAIVDLKCDTATPDLYLTQLIKGKMDALDCIAL